MFTARLRVLVALFAACSVIFAQTTTDRVGVVTSVLRAGQFVKALQILQPELERDPKNMQLWTLCGVSSFMFHHLPADEKGRTLPAVRRG